MPFLFNQEKSARSLVLLLTFGEASKLELFTLFESYVSSYDEICHQILEVSSDNTKSFLKGITMLAGIRKVILPISSAVVTHDKVEVSERTTLDDIISMINDKALIGFSYYCFNDKLTPSVIQATNRFIAYSIKEKGIERFKIIQGEKSEVYAADIAKRKIWDFVWYIRENKYYLGITLFVPDIPVSMNSRQKLFFLPEIAMSPMLAKLMINLSGVKRGGRLLDPFCGTGTILYEALRMGISSYGLDTNPKRVIITSKNLSKAKAEFSLAKNADFELRTGNATNLDRYFEKESIDAIVTEPILLPTLKSKPTFHEASKMVSKAKSIYIKALTSMSYVLRHGGRIVIVTPSLLTKEGRSVNMALPLHSIKGIRIFQPSSKYKFIYPVPVENQGTRWIRREIYVFERY